MQELSPKAMQARAIWEYARQAQLGLRMLNLTVIAKDLDPVVDFLRQIVHTETTTNTYQVLD